MAISCPRLQVHYAPSMWAVPSATAAAPQSALRSFAQSPWQPARLQAQQDPSVHTLSGTSMGTGWSLRLVNTDFAPLRPVQALVQATLDEVVAQMSHWQADSHMGQFNRAAAGSAWPLPAQFARVMDAAMDWAQRTGGAYDPTMGALVNLWGFGPRPDPLAAHSGQLPSESAIAQARRCSGYQQLAWQAGQQNLVQPGGVQLDLSGIAKGFAVDAVVERLQRAGWAHGLLEVGGELRAWGHKPGGAAWQVALAGAASDRYVQHVALRDGSLATSGDHWHAFTHKGQRYAHTLDARTGWPVAAALRSVTVWHAQCMHADAMATVITVLGPKEGWDWAVAHQVAAVLQMHDQPDAPAQAARCTPVWCEQLTTAPA